jgi:hypothetical protein
VGRYPNAGESDFKALRPSDLDIVNANAPIMMSEPDSGIRDLDRYPLT